MEFEDRLTNLRNKRNISQYEVAEKLNVDRSRYCKWEQGKSRPSYEMLAQIADFFNVTTDYLLGRTDDPKIHVIENPKQLEPLGVTEVRRTGTDPFTAEQIEAIRKVIQEEQNRAGE